LYSVSGFVGRPAVHEMGVMTVPVCPEAKTGMLAGVGRMPKIDHSFYVSPRCKRPNMKYLAFALALGVGLSASRAESQTLTTLLSFTGTGGPAPGGGPYGSLTLSGTTLYGMTQRGGGSGNGNIFSVGVDGSGFRNLYTFTGSGYGYTFRGGAIGTRPLGDLTLSGGTLFGSHGRCEQRHPF
jgi:uncharacterized repeat protein (TIGR03803 family)